MTCHKNALLFFAALSLLLYEQPTIGWGTNARNDPFPMYTSIDPQAFLSMRERQLIRGYPDEKGSKERLSISFSPFGQNANSAKTSSGTYHVPPTTGIGTCNVVGPACSQVTFPDGTCFNNVELGDIDGPWNLIGLMAGPIPANAPDDFTYPAPALLAALNTLYPGTLPGNLTTAQITSPPLPTAPPFGYASVPLKYRKRGIRWDLEFQLCGDFGFQFQGGVTEISQVLNCAIQNLTPVDQGSAPITSLNVTALLFDQLPEISKEINYNICNFTKVGVEDLYFCLYWRHLCPINFNRDLSWARLMVIPFFRLAGSAATGKEKDPSIAFSLPFGNNGSSSVNANVGLNFDFTETIEVGAEAALSHFFPKTFAHYRMPNNELQSGIFPYATSVKVKPGDTIYLAAKLSAYHFLERLSFWFQWVYIHHKEDRRTLTSDNNPAFITPKCLNSAWQVKLANIAFNYDVSPTISLGFLWQQPLHVRNAYNSTSVLFNVNAIF